MPDGMYEAATKLDSVETWVLDSSDGKFLAVLKNLAAFLSENLSMAGVLIDDEDIPDFIRVLAYARTTHSMRLFNLAGQCQPGLGGDILTVCDQCGVPGNVLEAESKVILGRVKMLVQLECYKQIFGPERRDRVLEILDGLMD